MYSSLYRCKLCFQILEVFIEMIKILYFLILVLVVILALFGFLILIEYLRYYKRKIVLKLRYTLSTETKSDD